MLDFLIKSLVKTNFSYGPVKSSILNLDGVEIIYPVLERYEIDELSKDNDNDNEKLKLGENLSLLVDHYNKNYKKALIVF